MHPLQEESSIQLWATHNARNSLSSSSIILPVQIFISCCCKQRDPALDGGASEAAHGPVLSQKRMCLRELRIIIIIENAENSLTKEKARRRSAIKFMHVYPPPSLDPPWIPLRNDDVCPKMGYHRCHSLNADGAMPNPFWVAVISSNRIWCLQLCTVAVLWATI